MKSLLRGLEPEEKIRLILSLTDISSENIIAALIDHYTKGHSAAAAAAMNGVTKGNLSVAQQSLECAAGIIEQVKEIDWARYGYAARSFESAHNFIGVMEAQRG